MSYEQMDLALAVLSIIALLIPFYFLMKDRYFILMVLSIAQILKFQAKWRKKREKIQMISIEDRHGNKIFLDTEDEQSIRKFLSVLEERKLNNE